MGEKIKCYCCGNMTDKEKQYCQICGAELQYNWIEKQNKKIIHWLWIIFCKHDDLFNYSVLSHRVNRVVAIETTIGVKMEVNRKDIICVQENS